MFEKNVGIIMKNNVLVDIEKISQFIRRLSGREAIRISAAQNWSYYKSF